MSPLSSEWAPDAAIAMTRQWVAHTTAESLGRATLTAILEGAL
jgi:hypothetical protein